MKLLLDAHAVIWAVDDPSKLGPSATVNLQDSANDLLLSAGTIWEIANPDLIVRANLRATSRRA